MFFFFFFKQKTAYEMRISDWSSDVCSSDLRVLPRGDIRHLVQDAGHVLLDLRVGHEQVPQAVLHGVRRVDGGHQPISFLSTSAAMSDPERTIRSMLGRMNGSTSSTSSA